MNSYVGWVEQSETQQYIIFSQKMLGFVPQPNLQLLVKAWKRTKKAERLHRPGSFVNQASEAIKGSSR